MEPETLTPAQDIHINCPARLFAHPEVVRHVYV